MSRPKVWRVHVKRISDTWVEVLAHSAQEAESLAGELPRVTAVLKESAFPPASSLEQDNFFSSLF